MLRRFTSSPQLSFLVVAAIFIVSLRRGPFQAIGTFGLSGLRWISYPLFIILIATIVARAMSRSSDRCDRDTEHASVPVGGRARFHITLGLVALLTSFGLYAASIGPWIHDDGGLYSLIGSELRHSVASIFIPGATYTHHNIFRPLGVFSGVVDHWIWGEWYPGYHITHLFLYATSVFLVGALARAITGDAVVSLASAAFFGLHPAHAEVAAWISSRPDLLWSIGYFAALLAFFRYLRGGRRLYLAVAVAALIFAQLAKEAAATLPVAMGLLVVYEHPDRRGLLRAVRLTLAMSAIVTALFFYQYAVQGGIRLAATGFHPRFVTLAFLSHTWWYLIYPFQEFLLDSVPMRVVFSALLTLPLIALARADVDRRLLAVGLLLVVSAGPGAFVMEPDPWLGEARIVYVPSAFLAIAVALAFIGWYRSRLSADRWIAVGLCAAALLGYTAVSAINAQPWVESGRLAAELPRRVRALSAVPFTGPLQLWGGPRAEMNPTPASLSQSFLETYWNARLSQRVDTDMRASRPLLNIPTSWVFPDGKSEKGTHSFHDDGGGPPLDSRALPDIREVRAVEAHVFLWSPRLHQVSDITDAVRRHLQAPCASPRDTRAVFGGPGTEGRWRGRTWGGAQELTDDRVRWSPGRCDRLVFTLRLATLGRPHPFWNHMVVSWRGSGAIAVDRELMRISLTAVADGAAHEYDVPLRRHPRWLLLEEVTGLTLDLPRYPAGVELSGAQLMRNAE